MVYSHHVFLVHISILRPLWEEVHTLGAHQHFFCPFILPVISRCLTTLLKEMALFSVCLSEHCWRDITVNSSITQMWWMSWGDSITDLFDQFLNILSLSNGLFVVEHRWNGDAVGKKVNQSLAVARPFSTLHLTFQQSARARKRSGNDHFSQEGKSVK